MAEFINTIDALGDEVVLNSIIDRSITEFKDDQLTTIGNYAFNGCSSLRVVDLPNMKSSGESAFTNCDIVEFNIPNATSLGRYGCQNNPNLKTFYGPKITALGQTCFQGCNSLEYVELPVITNGLHDAVQRCAALKEVRAPMLTTLNNAFWDCSSLEKADYPLVSKLEGGFTFYNCYSLKTVNFTNVTAIVGNNTTFQRCFSLPILDFPSLTSIAGSNTFKQCAILDTILLRTESGVVSLSNGNDFTNTPFTTGTGGKIYVPRALISAYQTATNWSSLYALGKCEFLAVEDVTVDGTATGELKKCLNVSLDKTTLSFTGTGSQTLTATFTPALPYVDKIIWSSNDRSVVIVDNGVVTAVGNGTAIITVTCGDKSASCNVTVSGVNAPVPYWSISEAVTLDGVDDYIDTGVALFAEPNDFTIVIKCTYGTYYIVDCKTGESYSHGQCAGGLVIGNSYKGTSIWYRNIGGTFTSVNLSTPTATASTTAIAVRYVAGAMDAMYYKDKNGNVMSMLPTTPEYAKTYNTLTIGCLKDGDGSMSGFANTTVSTFDIYSSALDDATIASKLQAL